MSNRQNVFAIVFALIAVAGFAAMGPAPINARQDLTLVRVSPGVVAQSIATSERAALNVAATE